MWTFFIWLFYDTRCDVAIALIADASGLKSVVFGSSISPNTILQTSSDDLARLLPKTPDGTWPQVHGLSRMRGCDIRRWGPDTHTPPLVPRRPFQVGKARVFWKRTLPPEKWKRIGKVLHHFPNLGARNNEDLISLIHLP